MPASYCFWLYCDGVLAGKAHGQTWSEARRRADRFPSFVRWPR